MSKPYRSVVFVLTLVLLMVILPSGTPVESMSILSDVTLGDDDASLSDAETYAKHSGVSLDEALDRFHLQDVAGELDTKLSENEAETFAGLWIEHTPEFRVVVSFTEGGEKRIEPYLTEELVGNVELRTAKVSLIDLQKTQNELISSLTDLEIQFESEINVYENNITLAIVDTDKAHFDLALQNRLIQLPDYVMVITIPQRGEPESNIYGGLPLNQCNTSFSVQDIYGILSRGVTTAGHCGDNDFVIKYQNVELPRITRLKTGSYDVEWHITPGFTVTNQFKAGSTDIRRVTATKSRSNQVVGGYVCKYGVATGYTCGYISSKNVTGNVPNSAATFIRVDNTAGYNNLSSSGDSGGPWFLGNTAYGVHHGSSGVDPNDAIYMAINYVDGLGVSVVLDPVFADVPWDYWAWQVIERLYNSKVTAGCYTNPLRYCPNDTVTRAQMAVFLLKGIHGSSYTPPPVGSSTGFNDVPTTHWAAAWIKQLAAEGITGGCSANPPKYCPESTTTHAQMAVFLLRSKYTSAYWPPPVGSGTGFNDVPTTYWAAAWIKQLRVEGISDNLELIYDGCPSGSFCPESPVTRVLMAGLLVRTFDLP